MQNYCISVDWLQVCCHCNLLVEGTFHINGRPFELVRLHTETAMFTQIFELRYNGLPYATLQSKPRSTALKKELTLIKLANRVLYCENYIELLYGIINALDMKYIGITRLDLCYDCNLFYNGRKPSKFVQDFVMKPIDSKGGVYRAGSDSFRCNGSRSVSSSSKITSISFGSYNSRIRSYMYDKTLELKEVKDKPWIRDMWEKNGLVSDDDCHVWRSEISIKAEGADLLNLGTGELFRLSPKYLEHYEQIEKIFHFYAAKVFDFRINNGQKNRRNFNRIYLFNTEVKITCKPKYVSTAHDSGRMEKICYNKLAKLSETYSDLSSQYRIGLLTAMNFLQQLAGKKDALLGLENYKRYLDTFKCCSFLDSLDIAYMEAIETCADSKREISAEYAYQQYLDLKREQSCPDIVLNTSAERPKGSRSVVSDYAMIQPSINLIK